MTDPMSELDRRIGVLAEAQQGAFSREQAMQMGFSSRMIQHRLGSGRWAKTFDGIYRLRGTPVTTDLQLRSILVWGGPGSTLSHGAAATIWGFEKAPATFEVTVPVLKRAPSGVKTHYRKLEQSECAIHRGLRRTSPARTILDLALRHPLCADLGLDACLQRGLLTLDEFAEFVERFGGQGVPGTTRARGLIEDRAQDTGILRSRLERKLFRLLRKHGFPLPVAQYAVTDRWSTFSVDFAYPAWKVGIETDGYGPHSGRARFESDRHRSNILTLMGWKILHITWRRLTSDPNGVLREISQALGQPELLASRYNIGS